MGPTGQRGGELNSRMMSLFSQIEDPAVRDAGWEYMRFYDCEESVAIKTRIMVEGGLGRFVNPKYLRRFGYPEIERLSPRGWAETFEVAIETGRPEPYGRNSNVAVRADLNTQGSGACNRTGVGAYLRVTGSFGGSHNAQLFVTVGTTYQRPTHTACRS